MKYKLIYSKLKNNKIDLDLLRSIIGNDIELNIFFYKHSDLNRMITISALSKEKQMVTIDLKELKKKLT